MKKYLIIILCILHVACKKEIPSSDLQKEKWNGKIKSITTSTFYYDSLKAEPHLGKLFNKTIREFNTEGNETTSTFVNEEDEVESVKKFSYNSLKLKVVSTEMDEEGNLLMKTVFNYDKKNHLVELLSTDLITNQVTKQENIFDDKNNLISSTTYKNTNEIDFVAKNKYNEKNQMIEECIILPDNTIDYKAITTYNDKGYVIRNKGYASDGSQLWELFDDYKLFDKEGNWLLKYIFRDGKPINVVQIQIAYYP